MLIWYRLQHETKPRGKENAMSEELLRTLFPILIALIFVNFIWAFIVTAVKGPEPAGERPVSGRINQEWKDLDAGPEGNRKTIAEEIRPKTKREA